MPRRQNHYSMTSISQNINWIVKAKITTFVLDDPIVHNDCDFLGTKSFVLSITITILCFQSDFGTVTCIVDPQ